MTRGVVVAGCGLSILGLGEAESDQVWLWDLRRGASVGARSGLCIFGLGDTDSDQLWLWELSRRCQLCC